MKRLALLLALFVVGCATHSHLMSDLQRAQKWDVFYFQNGKIKVIVIPAEKWVFRNGCFRATEPVPYVQCEVFRVRPCTEECG